MRPYPDRMTTDGLGAVRIPLYIFLSRSAIIGVLRSVFRHRFDALRCLPRTCPMRIIGGPRRAPSERHPMPSVLAALRPCRCSGPCSPRMPLSVDAGPRRMLRIGMLPNVLYELPEGLRVRSIPCRIHALGASSDALGGLSPVYRNGLHALCSLGRPSGLKMLVFRRYIVAAMCGGGWRLLPSSGPFLPSHSKTVSELIAGAPCPCSRRSMMA